jgi:hypothetical protein
MSTLRFGHQSASVAGLYVLRRNQYIEWISLDSLHGKIVDCSSRFDGERDPRMLGSSLAS